jgi:hypothetical protein
MHLECTSVTAMLIYYSGYIQTHCQKNKKIKRADQILPEVYGTTLIYLLTKCTDIGRGKQNWQNCYEFDHILC